MNDPTTRTTLHRARKLRVEFGEPGGGVAVIAGERIPLGDLGLALLGSLNEPRPLGDALSALKPLMRSSSEWIETLRLAARLHAVGALVDPADPPATPSSHDGFDQAGIHIAMLQDQARTDAFIKAVEAQTRPGDVALDIGSGTGILALAAARAGARKVYALESGEIGDAARALFAANGFADKIELLRGRSSAIELPEPADIAVGEVFGHDPFDEHVLETFLDARRRHLKPAGLLLPRALTLGVQLSRTPPETARRRRFSRELTQAWHRAYGFNFDALLDWSSRAGAPFMAASTDVARWGVGETHRFPALPLDRAESTIVDLRTTIDITEACEFDAASLFFELDLGEGGSLSTEPDLATATSHWRNPVHLLPTAIQARPGDRFVARYERGSPGPATLTVAPAG